MLLNLGSGWRRFGTERKGITAKVLQEEVGSRKQPIRGNELILRPTLGSVGMVRIMDHFYLPARRERVT